MAKLVLTNASVTVNGTDLSDHANQVTIENSADEVDLTGFTVAGYREFGQGLKDCTINVTFWQDFAATSVDSVLQAFYNLSGTGVGTVVIKATQATVSATNPTYTLVSKLYNYGPISGAVGDGLAVEATFRHSGTAGLVRATA